MSLGIMDIIGTVMSGGVTGLLGTFLHMGADYLKAQQELKLKQLQFENDREMLKLQGEMIDKEWAHRTAVATLEAEGKRAEAAEVAFGESFKMEPNAYSGRVKPTAGQAWILVVLDFVRGIVRPGLTVYLCALTTLVYFQARELLSKENLDAAQAMQISDQIVYTILYLTTTCILWWFGQRNSAKQQMGKA